MTTNRKIKLRQTKTIAVVSDIVMPTVKSKYLLGIAKYAQERRNFTIRSVDLANIRSGNPLDGCDGVIMDTDESDVIELVKAAGLPVVDTTCSTSDPALISVDNDIRRMGNMAAEWFLRRGFRSFAYCGVKPEESVGFAETAAKAGCNCLVYDEEKITKVKLRKDHLARLLTGLKSWIPTLPPRTAVLCMNDIRAQHLLQTCLELGRAVPDDIAVMGQHNDIAICTCSPITITSIDANMQGVAYAAMRILDQAIDHPVKPKLRPTFLVRPIGIVERESTATYPVNPPWLAKALLLLDSNLDKPISAADLANAAGVSQTSLQKSFRKSFGTTVNKHILAAKMLTARRLLGEEGLTVKEVATRTGFSTPNYFCQKYHAFYGHAPSRDSKSRKFL